MAAAVVARVRALSGVARLTSPACPIPAGHHDVFHSLLTGKRVDVEGT